MSYVETKSDRIMSYHQDLNQFGGEDSVDDFIGEIISAFDAKDRQHLIVTLQKLTRRNTYAPQPSPG